MKQKLRIIWAIAAKDIVEALRNKNALAVILSALFVVIAYRLLPILGASSEPATVLAYDYGQSSLVEMLHTSTQIGLYTGYASPEHLKRLLAEGEVPELGLIIPADFNQTLAAGREPILTGYVNTWVGDRDAHDLEQIVENEIIALLGAPVDIQIADQKVALQPNSGGLGVTMGIALVFVTLMTGMLVPTHLILEEKQTKTLDVLMVSPATPMQIVLGKALTGLFYALLGCGVGLAMSFPLINHGGLIALTAVGGALFSVALGLCLGALFETRQEVTLWSWGIILPLFIPMFLSLLEELFPAGLVRAAQWLPSVALLHLFRTSFASDITASDWTAQLILVYASAALTLVLVTWLVRRADR